MFTSGSVQATFTHSRVFRETIIGFFLNETQNPWRFDSSESDGLKGRMRSMRKRRSVVLQKPQGLMTWRKSLNLRRAAQLQRHRDQWVRSSVEINQTPARIKTHSDCFNTRAFSWKSFGGTHVSIRYEFRAVKLMWRSSAHLIGNNFMKLQIRHIWDYWDLFLTLYKWLFFKAINKTRLLADLGPHVSQLNQHHLLPLYTIWTQSWVKYGQTQLLG